NVEIKGKTAYLSGSASDAQQARIVKGLLLLEPGIYKVNDDNLSFPKNDDASPSDLDSSLNQGSTRVIPVPAPR
ncbi:MAG: hypothetical protein AAF394_04870, partial [Planctomycetota bacterium]